MNNIIFAILFFFLIGINGCGKKDDNTDFDSKTDEVNKIDTTSKIEVIKTKEIKLPDDLPSDIPMYMNSKILSSIKGGTGPIVTYETDGKPLEVGEFYQSEMIKNGYNADSYNDNMMNKDGGILTYAKKGKEYTVSYRFDEKRDKTVVTIQTRDANK